MKSYEEMTRSVLEQAAAEKKRQARNKRIGWTVASCACCLCLMLLAVLSPGKGGPAQQPEGEAKVKLVMLNSENDTLPRELIRDVVEPYRYLIRVLDAGNLDEDAIRDLMDAEKEYARQLWAPDSTNRMFTSYGGKKAIISLMSAGRLQLCVDDYSVIKDYSVETTDTGYISTIGQLNKGTSQGICFDWTLSNASIDRIMEDPTVKLSSFSDTITVRVEFHDGTTETVIADVMIQDDGQVFIVQRGVSVSA